MDSLRAKLRAICMRLRSLPGRDRGMGDLDAELESHLEMHIADGMRQGLSEAEARRRALIRLGGAEQARQAYRERATLPWIESLARDLRYSVRTLAKHPAVTAIAIVSIALGIGANATIFSMVSRFLLRPAPVSDPSTLVSILITHVGDRCCNNFPWPVYADLRRDAKSFSGLAAYYQQVPASISGSGEPERVWGEAVTTNFFDVIELPMILGRGFAASEDAQPMIVLGERLWRRRFNADEAIVGRPVQLSGKTYTVVGVAPAAFHSIDQILDIQFWVPLGSAYGLVPNLPLEGKRDYHWLAVVGRVKPGISRSQVSAELDTLAKGYEKSFPATDKDNGFQVDRTGELPSIIRQTVTLFLMGLLMVALLVLAIAAMNVANLMFAQAASRQREMAVRIAVGATRARLRRQLLIESLLLAIGGGAAGLVLALWSTSGLSSFRFPAPVPLDIAVGVDWRVLLFAFGLSVISGLLLGLGPAWAASRPMLTNALKGEDALARPGRRVSLRNLLIVAQIAMAVVLLSVTVLFLRSLQSASNIAIGFASRDRLLLSVDPRVHGYTPQRTSIFFSQLRQRVAALPGVDSVAVTDVAPLSSGHRSDGFEVVGESNKQKTVPIAELYMASPRYFETMGIPRLAGRDFGAEKAGGPKVAIVNQAFAERLFGTANPVGRRVNGGGVTYEIIGVAGNVKSRTLGEDTRPVLFRSLDQTVADDPSLMGYTLVVETKGSPAALMDALRRQVYALDSTMAIYNEETMEEHVRTAYFLPRLAAMLFGVFGGIGIVLAAIGLYGVMSYTVGRRTREIGIRMAMGARRGTVEGLVLRQGMRLTLVAIVLGWPAAWMLARLASSFLYGIQPHDAFTFAVVPPLLALIAFAACWIPARRAASVDPMQALRTE
ncbi:MAG TPA: ABC transporter permease [Terracidiphilus sp.]|nr:ABC transporter permease [Terracidiphilus sp.]